jgi:hypothetical protein
VISRRALVNSFCTSERISEATVRRSSEVGHRPTSMRRRRPWMPRTTALDVRGLLQSCTPADQTGLANGRFFGGGEPTCVACQQRRRHGPAWHRAHSPTAALARRPARRGGSRGTASPGDSTTFTQSARSPRRVDRRGYCRDRAARWQRRRTTTPASRRVRQVRRRGRPGPKSFSGRSSASTDLDRARPSLLAGPRSCPGVHRRISSPQLPRRTASAPGRHPCRGSRRSDRPVSNPVDHRTCGG